jgi:heparan-sulfate lyase
MVITKAAQQQWKTTKDLDVLSYTNPSYSQLDHQRTVIFVDQKYFIIIDRAVGEAKGTVGVHFQLKEKSNPVFDRQQQRVYTTFGDGNNLMIQNLSTGPVSLKEEEGKVSYSYRQELTRPAFVFEKNKSGAASQTFVTVLYPFNGQKPPVVTLKEHSENDYENGSLQLTLTVDGKSRNITQRILP